MEPIPPEPQRLGRLMATALWATVLVVTGVSAAERLGLIDLASDAGVRCSTQIRFCEPVEPEPGEPAEGGTDRAAECRAAAGEATGTAVERLLENCVKNPQADGLATALERHKLNAARKAERAENRKSKEKKAKGEKDQNGEKGHEDGKAKSHDEGSDGGAKGKHGGGSGGDPGDGEQGSEQGDPDEGASEGDSDNPGNGRGKGRDGGGEAKGKASDVLDPLIPGAILPQL